MGDRIKRIKWQRDNGLKKKGDESCKICRPHFIAHVALIFYSFVIRHSCFVICHIWDRVWSKLILYINPCNIVNIIQSCTLNKPYTVSSPFHSSLHYSCLVPILQTKQVWLHCVANQRSHTLWFIGSENLSFENCAKSFKLPTITNINSILQKTSLEP